MNEPIVSVIIIFYNAGRFIEEAVDSVLDQKFPFWELLLVDDGSSDRSTHIARGYAERYSGQVRYFEHEGHENRGMSASRNLGIQHALGKYVSFLDADDAWYPNALFEQTAILEACPEAALVYGPLYWWYSWTGSPEDMDRDYVEKLGVPSDELIYPPKLMRLYLEDRAAVPSGILVRWEAIEQFGGFEDEFMGEYEDQVFCSKICLNAPVFASSRTWYRYRQHPDASVSVGHATGQTLKARLVFLNWLEGYLTQLGVRDRGVWWTLRQEFWLFSHPRLFYFLRHNRHRWQWVTKRFERIIF